CAPGRLTISFSSTSEPLKGVGAPGGTHLARRGSPLGPLHLDRSARLVAPERGHLRIEQKAVVAAHDQTRKSELSEPRERDVHPVLLPLVRRSFRRPPRIHTR